MSSRLQGCVAAFLLVALTTGSFALNSWNNDQPLGYHYDEPKKVRFVLSSEQDFQHPLLMLQLVRIVNRLVGGGSAHEVAIRGRLLAGSAETAAVVLMFFLTASRLGVAWGFLGAGLLAALPIVVVHAHYMKEDAFLFATGLAALVAIAKYVEAPSDRNGLVIGLMLGFVVSSHYKGLLVPLAAFLALPRAARRLWTGRHVRVLAVSSIMTFLLINIPLLSDLRTFSSGIEHSWRQALNGVFVPVDLSEYWLTYHLRFSLLPGLTTGVGVVAFWALGWATATFRRLDMCERMLLSYALLSYIVAELSPSKPPPDDARYVLTVVPSMCFFIAKGACALWRRSEGWLIGRAGLGCCLVSLILLPLVTSVRVVSAMNNDARDQARRWVLSQGHKAAFEVLTNASVRPEREFLGFAARPAQLRAAGYTHLVVSSLLYDRYLMTAHLKHVPELVAANRRAYEVLFALPFVEFRPTVPTLGFSNPTVRVIDLR